MFLRILNFLLLQRDHYIMSLNHILILLWETWSENHFLPHFELVEGFLNERIHHLLHILCSILKEVVKVFN